MVRKFYMPSKTLSESALHVINNYLHLPIGQTTVAAPYINNRRQKIRGALRVLVGKGTPEEIVEEATLIAFREKITLNALPENDVKKFLVHQHLGIDCSGLVYHILDAELWIQKKKNLRSVLRFPHALSPIRKLLCLLRPAENTNVHTFASDKNTHVVSLGDVQPGDMIIILESGDRFANPDHILLVHEVTYETSRPAFLSYTHTLAWSTDGVAGHGVRQGKIEISDMQKSLPEQAWTESGKTNEQNETWQHAKAAKILEIRRLQALS